MIDDAGHLLTNAHVVEGAEDIEVKLGGEDGETLDAKVVGAIPRPMSRCSRSIRRRADFRHSSWPTPRASP